MRSLRVCFAALSAATLLAAGAATAADLKIGVVNMERILRESKTAIGEAEVSMPNESSTQPVTNWRVYPIPTQGDLNLEIEVQEAQQLTIQVFSSTGQRVAELYNGSAARGLLKLTKSLQNLSTGLYFIQVRGSRGLDLKKKILLTK